ncbi:T-cell surface glycoprotein CD3 zeta chain [Trichomycterus rosablanca]|uniref:T-cell surface glycoprotein CD3 zeta chain n=1 Tax=Trichomycterus rosablanca TaxID=2290929 RepID=UPI002F35DD71
MGVKKTGALALLLFIISPAEAFSMYDPKFCYILDLFLLLYGIVITGLFLRKKFSKPKESVYSSLQGPQSTYEDLKRDPESGRTRGARRQMDDDTYTPLQNKTDDTYKSIQPKKDRRPNDQVYQGLSTATKDTYDSLHMKNLPPRR